MIRCFFHNLTIHHFTAIVWSRATRSNIFIRLVDESSRMIQSCTKSNSFFLSPYFGNSNSTLLRIFEGLTVFRQRVPKIQAMLGLIPCYGLVK